MKANHNLIDDVQEQRMLFMALSKSKDESKSQP
jgi:hypothetical protein